MTKIKHLTIVIVLTPRAGAKHELWFNKLASGVSPWDKHSSGLYYKHVMIVNYASSSVNKLKASLNDDARFILYDRHMFIVQATAYLVSSSLTE